MKLGNVLPDWIWKAGLGGLFLLLGSVGSWSQQPTASSSSTDATAAAIRELQQQVNELRSAMAEMRAESERYRAENTELRHELQTPRGPSIASTGSPRISAPPQDSYQMGSPGNNDPASAKSPQASRTASLEDRVASLEESTQLVNSKVDDQYQTKVESASKYRVRLSGIVLLNLFSNHGATDNQDFPSYVTGSSTGTETSAQPCGNQKLVWKCLDPLWRGQKPQQACRRILPADFPKRGTESIPAFSVCAQPACAWIGKILR